MRHQRAVPRRWIATLLPVAGTAVFLFFCFEFNPRKVGVFLYVGLFGFGLCQAAALTNDFAGDLFEDERRNGTLGLLYLTGLSSSELFLARISGGLMIGLNRIIALLPCLLLPFVMRAVPWSGSVATIETLLCWAFFCVGVRIFSSSLFSDRSASDLFYQGCLVGVAGGLLAVSALNKLLTGAPLAAQWLQFSPGYAFVILFKQFGAVKASELHVANLVTLAAGAACLLGAGAILRRSWQNQVAGEKSRKWRAWLQKREQQHRRSARMLWLDSFPYAWLASRWSLTHRASWIAMGMILLAWLAAYFAWGKYWLAPMNFWLTALLLGLAVRWTLHYSTARQIAEDRSGGTLELILTTALPPAEIVAGQELLWKRTAYPVFRALALIYLAFFIVGALGRPWGAMQWTTYLLIWVGVSSVGPWTNTEGIWTTFWVSLNIGRPAYALQRYLWTGGGILSISVQFVIHADKLARIPYGTWFEVGISAALAAPILVASLSNNWITARLGVRRKILEDFREIATEPLPDKNDPRLKSWSVAQRFFKPEPEKVL